MEKSEIIKNLVANKELVIKTCEAIDVDTFFTKKGEKWSSGGHIEHLYYSIKPLNQLFLLPKFIMTAWVGKPNRPSRTYEKLVEKYWELLAKRNPTVNKFGPKSNKHFTKDELLKKFEKQYDDLAKELEKNWTEESLDNYLIPHPLLGKLTVREMMMFTVYHTLHHLKSMG